MKASVPIAIDAQPTLSSFPLSTCKNCRRDLRRKSFTMPRFDRWATLCLSFPLARLLGPRQGTRVPILMYHSISDNLFGMSHPYYHINTSPEVFSEQMRWLRYGGYRTIDLREAWTGLETGKDMSKTVVITFDDGYRDFYTDGIEIMKQCGFTATIFLATDRIRETPARIEGADYLTWNEVRELHAAGISFGSHTVTHPDLRSLGPEQIEYELGRSKEIIEQHLGAPVESFAYPFAFPEEDGCFTRFLEDLMGNLGYEVGVSTILGRASRKNNKFFLPRLPVNGWDDAGLLRAKLEGGYDWLHWPQLMKKSVFHHTTIMQRASRVQGSSPTRI
jgi:peptidoglycan/xylan/chitin deacetylase (PgdA/CDA1 family)